MGNHERRLGRARREGGRCRCRPYAKGPRFAFRLLDYDRRPIGDEVMLNAREPIFALKIEEYIPDQGRAHDATLVDIDIIRQQLASQERTDSLVQAQQEMVWRRNEREQAFPAQPISLATGASSTPRSGSLRTSRSRVSRRPAT
eukprot:PhM_4_TR3441/c1_g2_i1/m.21960